MRILPIICLGLSFLTANGQNTNEADHLFDIGRKLVSTNSDSVKKIISEIRTESIETKYEWGHVQSDLLEAWLSYWNHDLEISARLLLEVIEHAENFRNDSYEEGQARTLLGLIYRRLNDFDKADKQFKEAARSYQNIDSTHNYGEALNNLGTLQGMKGNYSEALTYFMESMEIAKTQKDSSSIAASMNNISVAYSLMNDHSEAIKFSKSAFTIIKDIKDSLAMAYSYIITGENFKAAGQIDSAEFYNYSVIKYVENHFADNPKYKEFLYEAYQNIAASYYSQDRIDDAKSMVVKSLKFRSKNENSGIEDSYTLLAGYHQSLQNIDSAIYYSKKALESSQFNKSKRQARGATKRLASIYEQIKKYDSALLYTKLYHTYNDSLYNESTEKKFGKLKIELATTEKQNEIDLLKKQKEIDEAREELLIFSVISIIMLSIASVFILIYRHKNNQKKLRIKELALKSEIDQKEQKLQQQALHMINMNNQMSDIEDNLRNVRKKENYTSREIQKLLSNITVSKSMDSEWKRFEEYFSNINPEFYEKLARDQNNLTHQERRVAALIKLGLNNREISGLLNIEQKSVSMNRYRLKKKLGLQDREDLTVYLQKI